MTEPGTITHVEYDPDAYIPGLTNPTTQNGPALRLFVNRAGRPMQDVAWITSYRLGSLLWVSYWDATGKTQYGPIAYCRPAEGVLNALQHWVDTGEYIPVEI